MQCTRLGIVLPAWALGIASVGLQMNYSVNSLKEIYMEGYRGYWEPRLYLRCSVLREESGF